MNAYFWLRINWKFRCSQECAVFRKPSMTVLNLGWVCLLLGSLLIVSISYHAAQQDQLVAIISFAATISSILLALVAIFYSIISGSSIERSLGEIKASAENSRNASDKLENLSFNLTKKIDEITELRYTVGEVREKVDLLSTKPLETSLTGSVEKTENNQIKYDESQMYGNGFVGSVVAFYIAALSFETKKAFKIEKVLPELPPAKMGMYKGTILSMKMFGAIEMERNQDEWLVIKLNALDKDQILNWMEKNKNKTPVKRDRRAVEDFFAA